MINLWAEFALGNAYGLAVWAGWSDYRLGLRPFRRW